MWQKNSLKGNAGKEGPAFLNPWLLTCSLARKERPNSTMLHKCAHGTLKPKTLLVVNPD
jgi:hypothetical protein